MDYEDTIITNGIKKMLTVQEASRVLYVHPNTLRQWNNQGIIRAYRLGPRADRRFEQDDIVYLLSKLERNGGNPK